MVINQHYWGFFPFLRTEKPIESFVVREQMLDKHLFISNTILDSAVLIKINTTILAEHFLLSLEQPD